MQLPLLRIFAGVLLLFGGRRLFWLFVGLLGFFVGFTIAERFFSPQPAWLLLLIGVGCGLIGILLAVFLQRIAIAIAGFLAGATFAGTLAESAGWHIGPVFLYVVGGVLGAILLSVVFDWALIILTSITGASFVVQSLPMETSFKTVAFAVLLIAGIFVQARYLAPATISRKEVNAG
jgi:hypothetical protein